MSDKIREEWDSIPEIDPPTFDDIDRMIGNNRYPDIIPVKSTIVPLKSGSYINANLITLSSKYIATQAPLPTTMSNFWDMCIENECNLIVNLTAFTAAKPRRRILSHQYWPDSSEADMVFDNVTISYNKCAYLTSDVAVYSLTIHSSHKDHTVELVHYIGWPDKGVPQDTHSLMSILSYVLEHHYTMPIIHCSAGIGRAGVFIAAWELIKHNQPSLYQTIIKMRSCRKNMIQTYEQYELVYSLIRLYRKTGCITS